MCIEMNLPPEVVLALWDAVSRSSVDDFLTIWASCGAGGPTAAGNPAFLGRGLLRIRIRCLGQSCWWQGIE